MKGNGIKSSVNQGPTFRDALNKAKCDFAANRSDPKAQFVLGFFRLAHWARTGGREKRAISVPIVMAYRLVVEMLLGIELRPKTQVGAGLRLFHGQGLVINDRAVLGGNVTLRHGVTIGSLVDGGPCPVIEDDVEFGASSLVLGPVRIGKGAKIGAGAIVVRDVPAGGVARGPAAEVFQPKPFTASPGVSIEHETPSDAG